MQCLKAERAWALEPDRLHPYWLNCCLTVTDLSLWLRVVTPRRAPERPAQYGHSVSLSYCRLYPRVVTGESGIVLCGGMELRLLLELFTR